MHPVIILGFRQEDTLLLDMPSESEGENILHFKHCHCPLNIKAKLLAAGNFSLKQSVSSKFIHSSEFYPQSLREKTIVIECPQITTVHF